MNPQLCIGFLVFAVCSCTKKSPGNHGDKRNTIMEDSTVASMSEHQASRLFRETMIPLVDWPEQPIVDRLNLIDREASKIGLSVEMSPGLRSRPMTCPALRVRNIPFMAAIQATVDSTILRVRIEDSGVLFFYLASEDRSSPILREANAPFSAK